MDCKPLTDDRSAGPSRAGVFILSLLLSAASAAPAQEKAVEERFTLENGLEVILKPADRLDLAACLIGYRAGVVNEPPERHGLAHLVEHLVFRAATTSFKAGEAEKAQTAAGPFGKPFIDANAETLHDFTYYYSICAPEKLEQALQIEAERMRTCEFTKELLDAERVRALEEVAATFKNPAAVAYHTALDLTYAKLRYRLPKVGGAESMKAATLDEARAFYETWYRPNNAVLIIYGKFNAANVKDAIKEHFGPYSKAELPKVEMPDEPERKGQRAVVKGDVKQLMMTWLAAPNGTKEKAAIMAAICHLLRSRGKIHEHGRDVFLFEEVFNRGRSMTVLSAALTVDADPDAAADAVQEWLDAFTIDEKKLDAARTSLRNEFSGNDVFPLGFIPKEKKERYASSLVQIAINRMRAESAGHGRIEELLKLVDALTVDDVTAAVKKHFSKGRANIVIVR